MSAAPFVIERVYNAPVERVWKAITDKNDMKQWYFDIANFAPTVGCEFSFTGGPPDKCYVHLCKVTEVIPGKKITYSWRYEGYAGNSFVTFELFAEGTGTRLKLTHAGLDTFPASNPDLAANNFAFGWTALIGEMLPNFLEKETTI
ncbi:MAG TPA: SRPBCC domain-containing protein [Chitinophagaceae bacterium]|nr:SRPBCC domain-containing protein [Chitinophagaceae bacterium]